MTKLAMLILGVGPDREFLLGGKFMVVEKLLRFLLL
jgi:hypothetical protein